MKITGFVMTLGSVLLLGSSAQAGVRDNVYAAFSRCNQIPDDRQWLNCIYGAAQPMRMQLGLPPAPDSQVRLVPTLPDQHPTTQATVTPSAVPTPNRRGLLAYFLGGNSVVQNATLKSYSFDRNGHFIVVLSNGEIWQQADDDRILAGWRSSPTHYVVSIHTGALGGYILAVQGEDQAYKVTRKS